MDWIDFILGFVLGVIITGFGIIFTLAYIITNN